MQRDLAERLEERSSRVASLEEENSQLRAALAAAGKGGSGGEAAAELSMLKEQFANHAKERTALKTILESKIHALVGDIQQSAHALAGEEAPRQAGARIVRQVGALDKLVGATINAMRAAAPQ